jgi:NADH dehydrogenase FAD-containing subunit
MGPGMLGGTYRPEQVRFHIKKTAEDRGGEFIPGKVSRIDPDDQSLALESGEKIIYDVVSFNIGSTVPVDFLGETTEHILPAKPVENLWRARNLIKETIGKGPMRIGVVGGGPAGVEITGNIWRVVAEEKGRAKIILFSGSEILSDFPPKARWLVLRSFKRRGIEVMEDVYIDRLENGQLVSREGQKFSLDVAVIAVGVRPLAVFKDSGLPTDKEGALLINHYLQSIEYPQIFGGGDCVNLQDRPLNKVGAYAVRQNPILYHNLLGALEDKEMQAFHPQRVYLLIFNLGDGKAIFCRQKLVFDGRVAFLYKNYLDKKFIKKFQ